MNSEIQYNSETNPPKDTHYQYGDSVRIPRSNGKIEVWTVRGETKDGEISVYNRDLSVKILPKDVLDKYNGPLGVGSVVKVLRSNNLVDDGWEIRAFHDEEDPNKETTVTIHKTLPTDEGDKIFQKKVTLKSLESIN